MPRQSFAWWCFADRGVGDADLLRRAQGIGYKAVEQIPPALFARAADSGLAVAAHSGHQSISSGLNDSREHDRIEREIRGSLALAVAHHIPSLIVFSGDRRDGLTDAEGVRNAARILRRVAPPAEEAGVTLILELLNSKVDHAGYQADRTAWGVDVCDQVGSPRVRLLYDIYHMQVMEGDVVSTIRQNAALIGHYHTAGVPGRRDLDGDQELHYPAILRAVADTGYTGYVGHEFIPKGDPVQALGAAYRACDI